MYGACRANDAGRGAEQHQRSVNKDDAAVAGIDPTLVAQKLHVDDGRQYEPCKADEKRADEAAELANVRKHGSDGAGYGHDDHPKRHLLAPSNAPFATPPPLPVAYPSLGRQRHRW